MRSLIDFAKEKRLNILFFGASVTVQKEGYRLYLCDMLDCVTGHSHIYDLCAHGGSGTIFGLANLKKRLLVNAYDLVFFEYLTGDYAGFTNLIETEAIITEIYESLLEKTANVVPIFMYREGADSPEKSKYRDIYSRLSNHYGLKAIEIDNHVATFINSVDRSKYFRDDCHLTALGGFLCAQIILNFIQRISCAPRLGHKRVLSESSNTQIIRPLECMKDYISPYNQEAYPYREILINETYSFKFKGKFHGFVVIVGPETGNLTVKINGTEERINLFDSLCFYERIGLWNYFFESENFSEVEIRVCSESVDFEVAREKRHEFALPRKIKLIGIQVSGSKLALKDPHHDCI